MIFGGLKWGWVDLKGEEMVTYKVFFFFVWWLFVRLVLVLVLFWPFTEASSVWECGCFSLLYG